MRFTGTVCCGEISDEIYEIYTFLQNGLNSILECLVSIFLNIFSFLTTFRMAHLIRLVFEWGKLTTL